MYNINCKDIVSSFNSVRKSQILKIFIKIIPALVILSVWIVLNNL